MKKWFSLIGTTLYFSGAIVYGATIDYLGIIEILAMILLLFGGIFTGLSLSDNKRRSLAKL